MKALRTVPVERLTELLIYDPKTGIFRWRVRRSGNALAGEIAGCVNARGYLIIYIDNAGFRAHRIAWAMMTGAWPAGQVDHKNRRKSDNRWRNLRLASQPQNSANAGIRKDNTSGIKGVRWCRSKRRWIASIAAGGHRKTLGTFRTKAPAIACRRNAARALHGEFARP